MTRYRTSPISAAFHRLARRYASPGVRAVVRDVAASARRVLVLLPVVLLGNARADEALQLPSRDKLHLFLLAGQSNMAGRGEVEARDQEPIPQVLSLDAAGNWVKARDPIHWDKPSAGVGLARSFAIEYLKRHPGVTVGFIPAACGGSPISTWAPGQYFDQTHSHPYDDALARTRRALQFGTLRGILWHQGESDSTPDLAPEYEAALTTLITRLRSELGAQRVPFLIGQLGQFTAVPWNEPTRTVDTAQRHVAASVPLAAFVSSDGLTSNPDNIHFNAASLREFGKRYAAAFAGLEKKASAANRRAATSGRAARVH
jgi:Carbohydrate esterase, sialic acid-specific acetylesterase